MAIGQTGLGKSTLVNTLFSSNLVHSKGRFHSDESLRGTTEIINHSQGKLPLLSIHSQYTLNLYNL